MLSFLRDPLGALAAVDDVRAYLDAGLALYGPLTLPVARWLEHLPLPAARRFVTHRARLDARINALIAQAAERDDLLAMLLAARDAEAGDDERETARTAGRPLDDCWVRDEIMTLVLAGHETTASALTWAWRLLAQHPEAEACLHAEVDALGGRPPTLEDLLRLPYTRAPYQRHAAFRTARASPVCARRVGVGERSPRRTGRR
jgi:cytochrome P450